MGFSCTVNMSIIDEMSNPHPHVSASSRGCPQVYAAPLLLGPRRTQPTGARNARTWLPRGYAAPLLCYHWPLMPTGEVRLLQRLSTSA